ncbi:MAG TPA: rhomboid family intramembrane serine protease [Polyangia bacterium]|nr:rhomboid family intramembrane serine protease [Polyangia bacterium]
MLLPLRDVDYFRVRRPAVTLALAAINVAVFVYVATLPPGERQLFAYAAGMVPYALTHGLPGAWPAAASVVTAMFVHGDVLHLVGNLWFLWVFGQRLENAMGSARFLLFYALAGLIAAGAQLAADPSSMIPMIGASGAIAGVLGGYARQFPHARVRTLVFVILIFVWTLPAWWLLGAWFLGQILSAAGGGPGVAWFAHLGGFAFGFLTVRWFIPRRREPAPRPLVYYLARE